MLTCCVKDDKHEDAEEFLDLFLDALDEELVELRAYISTHKQASAPSAKDLEEEAQSAEGQTAQGKRDYAVRHLSFSLFTELDIANTCTDTDRQVQSSRPSRAYSVEDPVRPFARQAGPTPSLSKPGDLSNSTYRSVFPTFHPYICSGD